MKQLQFLYDYRGFGDLQLLDDDMVVIDDYESRTGSRDRAGKLRNAIDPNHEWAIIEPSADTVEDGMWVRSSENGWKIRLFRKGNAGWEYTHYLIHPDGGKGGTLGCIGILGTDALSFRHELDDILKEQGIINVSIHKTEE